MPYILAMNIIMATNIDKFLLFLYFLIVPFQSLYPIYILLSNQSDSEYPLIVLVSFGNYFLMLLPPMYHL